MWMKWVNKNTEEKMRIMWIITWEDKKAKAEEVQQVWF